MFPEPSLCYRHELSDEQSLLPIIGPHELVGILCDISLHGLWLDEVIWELNAPVLSSVLVHMILELFEGQSDQEGDSEILHRDHLLVFQLRCWIDVRVIEKLKLVLKFCNGCLNSLGIVFAEVLVEEVPVEFYKKPQNGFLMVNQGRGVDVEGLDHLIQRCGWVWGQ